MPTCIVILPCNRMQGIFFLKKDNFNFRSILKLINGNCIEMIIIVEP